MASDMESSYGIYKNGELAKIVAINMHGYNTTIDGAGTQPLPDPDPRPARSFEFTVPSSWVGKEVGVQWLMANGSDAITGVTFDGWSYNYELDNGKPVKLDNVTTGDTLKAGEVLKVSVPDSSAALLTLL